VYFLARYVFLAQVLNSAVQVGRLQVERVQAERDNASGVKQCKWTGAAQAERSSAGSAEQCKLRGARQIAQLGGYLIAKY
jgi:hypothetical protein